MGIIGKIVGGVAGVGLLAGGAAAFQDNAVRDEAGVVQEAGAVGAFRVRVGDCLSNPGMGLVESFDVVPCAEPHDSEVYHAFDLQFPDWPGEGELSAEAELGCYERFFGFVGMTYEQSIYEFTWLEPTRDSWEQLDDREVVCFVSRYDGAVKAGTVRNASR